MSSYNWSNFIVRINVNAAVEKLSWCWAPQQGMEYWFLRLSEYKKYDDSVRENNEPVQKGDKYKWLWHGWADDTVEYGDIVECNGKDFFKIQFWKSGHLFRYNKKEGTENIVELVQENISDDEQGRQYYHLGCKTGWTFYLTNLKSLLEGGIDLRNKNAALQNVLNA